MFESVKSGYLFKGSATDWGPIYETDFFKKMVLPVIKREMSIRKKT